MCLYSGVQMRVRGSVLLSFCLHKLPTPTPQGVLNLNPRDITKLNILLRDEKKIMLGNVRYYKHNVLKSHFSPLEHLFFHVDILRIHMLNKWGVFFSLQTIMLEKCLNRLVCYNLL